MEIVSSRGMQGLHWPGFTHTSGSWDYTNNRKIGLSHKRTREPLQVFPTHDLKEELSSNDIKDEEFRAGKAGGCKEADSEGDNSLLELIKACGNSKDLHEGSKIHTHILKQGLLKRDIYFGTALVHMYAKCGALAKAQDVFDELPFRDVASWNAIIIGYATHGFGDEAITCFEQMQGEGIFPNAITFIGVLKACSIMGAVERGAEIHAEIQRQGLLGEHILLGTALVDMFAKCGALSKAREVFDKLPARDVASWTALLAGYAQHGLCDEALGCYKQMCNQDLYPNIITFVCILKACGSMGAIDKGEQIHADISRRGLLEKGIVLGNALLDMYAKCDHLTKAEKLFYELPEHDVVSWNVLIAAYAEQGLGDDALNCFAQMQDEGSPPNTVTFLALLKACGSIGAAKNGIKVHARIVRSGLLDISIPLNNALVDMYAKCGAFARAAGAFDGLPVQELASWNALIAGYAQHGHGMKAWDCFKRMHDEGTSPDMVTYLCILKACSSMGAANKGEQIHAEVVRQGLLGKSIVLCNALIDMYGKCGMLAKAGRLFDELPTRDVASWNTIMAAYVQHGLGSEALVYFDWMQDQAIFPDVVTFVCILQACGRTGAIEKGKEIHGQVMKRGLLKAHAMVGTALVDMYAKCGALAEAQALFDELASRDVALWTALIAGYAKHGHSDVALACYAHMQEEGLRPNLVTFICVLKCCGKLGEVALGKDIHGIICEESLLEKSAVLGAALVDMYAKCGDLTKAQQAFDELPVRDVGSWTALMAGYVQHGRDAAALDCYQRMQGEGFSPSAVTFFCILKACGSLGAAEKGEEIRTEVSRQDLLGENVEIGTALLDMYAKCGVLAKAEEVFDKLVVQDNVSWTALMAGYCQIGNSRRVFDLFRKMVLKYVEPDASTFGLLLATFSHAGLVEEGQMCFSTWSCIYGVSPSIGNYICLVDLFSRAGNFEKAASVIKYVPPSDCLVLWSALLGACGSPDRVDVGLGTWAFENVLQEDANYAAAYVCMRNMYAAAGMQEGANKG